MPKSSTIAPTQAWTFLSNHAHVLIALAARADVRLRDVASQVGITERAVQKILSDLEGEGLVTRARVGRRNRYRLHLDQPLRHPLESHKRVRELIELVTSPLADSTRKKAAPAPRSPARGTRK